MNKRGMTFTEIIVAMLILSLVVAGSFAAFSVGEKFTGRAQNRTIAMNFARQTLEGLRNDVRASTWPGGPGDPLEEDSGLPHNVSITAGRLPAGATQSYKVTDVDVDSDSVIDYKIVTVTVNWTAP